jgi:hypothetical protein
MKRTLLALVFIGLSTAGANAATVVCGGTVTYLAFHASNSFMIQLSSMNTPVFFCNPETTWSVAGTSYTTGPNTCKALIAQFTAAKLAGLEFSGIYFDGDEVPESCSSWGGWRSANIRYFAF